MSEHEILGLAESRGWNVIHEGLAGNNNQFRLVKTGEADVMAWFSGSGVFVDAMGRKQHFYSADSLMQHLRSQK
jgi:hypothetical protein